MKRFLGIALILILLVGGSVLFVGKNDKGSSGIQPTPILVKDIKKEKQSDKILMEFMVKKPSIVKKYDFSNKEQDTTNPTVEGNLGNINYLVKVTGDGEYSRTISIVLSKQGKSVSSKVLKDYMLVGYIYEIEMDNIRYLMVDTYTGGAHCCSELYIFSTNPVDGVKSYMIDMGNIDVVDKDNFFIYEGNLVFTTYNDDFAYFETSYADSGYMFFPIFYRLDKVGYMIDRSSYKNYYQALYNEKVIYSDNNNRECFPDNGKQTPFTALVERFSLGYMAGLDKIKLKDEFVKDWCVNNLSVFTYPEAGDMADEVFRKLNAL